MTHDPAEVAVAASVAQPDRTSGGEGKASGAILGVLVIGIFSNGMGVLGVNDFVQQVIQGGILLFALFVEYLQGKVVSVKDNAPEAVVRKEPA